MHHSVVLQSQEADLALGQAWGGGEVEGAGRPRRNVHSTAAYYTEC